MRGGERVQSYLVPSLHRHTDGTGSTSGVTKKSVLAGKSYILMSVCKTNLGKTTMRLNFCFQNKTSLAKNLQMIYRGRRGLQPCYKSWFLQVKTEHTLRQQACVPWNTFPMAKLLLGINMLFLPVSCTA